MIRRDAGADYLLIAQHDHAVLAGALARRLGDARGRWRPTRFDETVAGVANHDCGWPAHDETPTLNRSGLPLHVFEVPVGVATRVWAESSERAAAYGNWARMLVSLHVFNLSSTALSQLGAMSRTDVFEVNKFQHRQIEIQEGLRVQLGLATDVPLQMGLAKPGTSTADDELIYDFRLLTAMDRISLALCCGERLFPAMEDVRPGVGMEPVRVDLGMPDSATIVVTPWMFEGGGAIELMAPARRVRKGTWGSVEEFRAAFAGAAVEEVKLRVAAG